MDENTAKTLLIAFALCMAVVGIVRLTELVIDYLDRKADNLGHEVGQSWMEEKVKEDKV